MAEDVLETCFENRLLERASAGVTVHLRLVGAEGLPDRVAPLSEPQGLHSYGGEAAELAAFEGATRVLGGGLTEGMVRFAARKEFARTVEDVLARRSRILFLDAQLATQLSGRVAEILRDETGADPRVEAFIELARLYLTMPL